MKRLVLALALVPPSFAGLVATSTSARADDVELGVFFGAATGGHGPGRGYVALDLRRSLDVPRERVVRTPRVLPRPYAPTAVPFGPVVAAPTWGGPLWIPEHEVCRTEVVCEPAVYRDRCVPVYGDVEVPVYDEVCVPVFEDVCVPVFEERLVPVYDRVIDPRSGRPRKVLVGTRVERVQVGERAERRKVGERTERVVVGSRTERVKVGERTERVLVRAETTRVVEVRDVVPGRFVTVVDGPVVRGRAPGEVMTRAQYEAEMALVAGVAGRGEGSEGREVRRGPPIPRSVPVAHR